MPIDRPQARAVPEGSDGVDGARGRQPPIIYLVDAAQGQTGGLRAAANIARALDGEVRVVAVLPETGVFADAALAPFWRVERLPIPMLSRRARAVLGYGPRLLAESRRLRRLMERDGAETLILNDFYLMHGTPLRAMGFRGRILSWVRCDPALFPGALARLWLSRTARTADRIVAVSEFIRGRIAPHIGGREAALLYDAVEPPGRSLHDPRSGRVVSVGNYIEGKGQDDAVGAFAIAAARDPGLTLAFHGGDMGLAKNRAYRARLEGAAAALGLGGRIAFHGFAEDPFAPLAGAFAAINLSRSESFSMTVLEAQAAGIPVIAARSGGPAEIVEEGVTGHLVPVGDRAAAADRLLALARDPERAAAMGRAAAERAAARFSPAAFAGALRDALGRPPAGFPRM